ncbi:MAG: YitT family protein [Lachnospiraceae bacterium]|nr:YitT family protein [Lachnospiraceae bacterium]
METINDMLKFWIKKLFFIIFAILLIAVGVNLFLAPHNIAAGGLTGLAVIAESYFGWDRTITIWVGQAIVAVLALVFLGKEIFFNTVIGAGLLPVFIAIIPRYQLINDTMLSMIAGSIMFGIAASTLYHNKASSGGTAVPPLIFQKYFNWRPSLGLLVIDCIVVTLCLLVFDVDTFFFAILSNIITSIVMTQIENGVNKKKCIYIISEKHKEITNELLYELGRGVTILPATGAYTGSSTPMLMLVVSKPYYRQLIEIVNKHDEKCFMVTNIVADVHGEGFTFESGSV